MKTRSAYNPTSTTKAYYMLNNDCVDISGQANHGTPTSITYPQGKFGQAARFNGSTSLITIADNANLRFGTSNFTISVWIKPSTVAAGTKEIICKKNAGTNGGWDLYLAGNSLHWIQQSIIDYTTSITVNTDWTHIVASSSSNTITFYKNGIRLDSNAFTSPNYNLTNPLTIGGEVGTPSFPGLIDEVIIESRALSAKEVETYYRKSMLNYGFKKSIWRLLLSFTISESIALTETISTLRNRLFSITETITTSETVSMLKAMTFTISEALQLQETFISLRGIFFSVLESTGLVELGVTLKSKYSNISKNISIWTNKEK